MKRGIIITIIGLFIFLGAASCTKDSFLMNKSLFFEILHTRVSSTLKTGQILSIDDVKEVMDSVLKENHNFYISKDTLSSNTKVSSWGTGVFSPNYTTWVLFEDLMDNSLWSHSCKYYFVDAKSGEISEYYSQNPPIWSNFNLLKSRSYSEDAQPPQVSPLYLSEANARNNPDYTKWAVLMCGGTCKEDNQFVFYNDCKRIYNVLVDKYNYPKSHIFVLMSDGNDTAHDRNNYINGSWGYYDSSPADLDGDGSSDIYGSMTLSNVENAFEDISSSILSTDKLFIYTSGHGGTCVFGDTLVEGFYLWDGSDSLIPSVLTPSSLSSLISNNIPTNTEVNVLMQQCHSGAFISNLSTRCNTVTTSCSSGEIATATATRGYCEFSYFWVNAISGENPSGDLIDADSNDDGGVSFLESFQYANLNDSYSTETPQFFNTTNVYGYHNGIGGLVSRVPYITGPYNIQKDSYGDYYVIGMPSGSNVQWSCSNFVPGSSVANNGYRICANDNSKIYANQSVSATISNSYYNLSVTQSDIVLWKSGITIADDLIIGNLSSLGGTLRLVNDFSGAYGYTWSSNANWIVSEQGYYIATFTNPLRDDSEEVNISVNFYNPFNESTTICKTYYID